MTLLRSIARRLRHLFCRRQSEADMAEEMRFHLAQRAADYAADGLPDEEARLAAAQAAIAGCTCNCKAGKKGKK